MKKHIKKIVVAIGLTIFGLGVIKYAKEKTEVTIEVPVMQDSLAIIDGVYVDSVILDSNGK